jgi:hypothetical protein
MTTIESVRTISLSASEFQNSNLFLDHDPTCEDERKLRDDKELKRFYGTKFNQGNIKKLGYIG